MEFMRVLAIASVVLMCLVSAGSAASEFVRPWAQNDRALIVDAYEHNEIDLTRIVTDQRVAAFIHKGSDGLAPDYHCSGNQTERKLCRQTWRRYIIARELYHTRRALAKALGLKWGAYHLGRPGNPIEQAQHFLQYTDPSDEDVMVLDIEDNKPDTYMSLDDAERFARYIQKRTGRWPMLYTNGSTSLYIARNRDRFPVLSRLPLWYARYKPSIASHFPKGHWKTYDIWQFATQINCNKRSCPYRLPGTNLDIDINVVDMSVEELKSAWPIDQLVDPVQEKGPVLVVEDKEAAEPVPDSASPLPSRPLLNVALGGEEFIMPLPRYAPRPVTAMVLKAAYREKAEAIIGSWDDTIVEPIVDLQQTASVNGAVNDLY